MAKCKSCGAEIIWLKTAAGRNMPVDAEEVYFYADKDGKELFVTDNGVVVRGVQAEPNTIPHPRIGYVSHFATCPNADTHRKGRK